MSTEQNTVQATSLSHKIHDLTAPLIIASGFAAELEEARTLTLTLLSQLPEGTDPELLKQLSEQVGDEMEHCLLRITSSLAKLDTEIQGLRDG